MIENLVNQRKPKEFFVVWRAADDATDLRCTGPFPGERDAQRFVFSLPPGARRLITLGYPDPMPDLADHGVKR